MQIELPCKSSGVGPAVMSDHLAGRKEITVEGGFTGTLQIEMAACAAVGKPAFSAVLLFTGPGRQVLELPCHALRVRMNGLGAPDVTVSAEDGRVEGAALDVPDADGTGEAVALPEMDNHRVVCVGGPFLGTVIVDLADDDGPDARWKTAAVLAEPGYRVVDTDGRYARVIRKLSSGMGHPPVAICGLRPAPPAVLEHDMMELEAGAGLTPGDAAILRVCRRCGKSDDGPCLGEAADP